MKELNKTGVLHEIGVLYDIGVAAVLSVKADQREKRLGVLPKGEGDRGLKAYRHAKEAASLARALLYRLVDSYEEGED